MAPEAAGSVTVRSESPLRLSRLKGTFKVSSRIHSEGAASEGVDLGMLRVFASTQDPDATSGQWVFWLDPTLPTKSLNALVEVFARLGLLPLNFARAFESRLKEPEPVCIVADTNTLYHGSLLQALVLRKGYATHVAIADQVLMELQKQRETAYATKRTRPPGADSSAVAAQGAAQSLDKFDRWVRMARRSTSLCAGGRALRRIRATGHIVHVARPAEAMVRYFGGGRHSGEDTSSSSDESSEIVGSNALRDRLILEAAIRQRVALPGVPVWLLTDDANLAAQAKLEGVDVGFAWLPNGFEPRVLTSPFFSSRTLQLQHVSIEEFIEELLWSVGNLSLHPEGEARSFEARVPDDRRLRVLRELDDGAPTLDWQATTGERWSLATSVPQKAPAPKALITALVAALERPIPSPADEGGRYVLQYLRALGWVHQETLTARGRALAEAWKQLDYSNADAWAAWLEDAGRDIRKLGPIARVLGELRVMGSASDSELVERLGTGTSSRSIGSQLVLASSFGLSVRLGSKGRESRDWTAASAEQAVLTAVRALSRTTTAGVTAVSIARLFTALQRPESPPMPFHVFRRSLVRLEEAGRIVLSGSTPDGDTVNVNALIPTGADPWVEFASIKLGSGGNIVTGRSAKVVQLQEVQT